MLPMKVTNILAVASQELQNSHIISHRLDARILLGYCLNLSAEEIIFNPDLTLTQKQVDNFFALIKRRCDREPVSHIIGKREFFGKDFLVNSKVLDPRPDSETLIEAVLSQFPNKEKTLEILELGVGSGCLILTLLKIFKNAQGIGVDISKDALDVAIQNSSADNLNERCKFIESNWFSTLNQKFDLIISNPPYIATDQINSLQDEVKNYDPRTALDGGPDGFDCYREISKNIVNFLKPDAIIILEIGQNQENLVIEIFISVGLKFIESKKDLGGIIRCLVFKKIS
jgi:release factor glutamine methyltransferase